MRPTRTRPWLRALLAGCLLLLAACAGPPEHRVRLPFGNVRGVEPEGLADLGRRFTQEREFVLGLVPGVEERFVELWQLDEVGSEEFDRENVGGVTRQPLRGAFGLVRLLPGWMRNTRVLLGARTSDTTLTHELVHAYLGDDWDTLPPALEEGLADWVAMQKHVRSKRRSEHFTVLLGAGPPLRLQLLEPRRVNVGRLEHDVPRPVRPLAPAAVLALGDASPWNRDELIDTVWVYAMGHYLAERTVERIGLEGLLELARAAGEAGHAQIPPAWVLEAADVDADELDLVDLARRQSDAMLASALQEESLLTLLQRLYLGSGRPGEGVESCFRRLRAALQVGSRRPVLVTDLPGFERAVLELEASLLIALGDSADRARAAGPSGGEALPASRVGLPAR